MTLGSVLARGATQLNLPRRSRTKALMMLLSAEMPVNAMADLLDEHDTRLWRVLMHYVEQAHAKSDWNAVRRIAVDETSARRGHRYVTNVLDAENSRLLLMVEGRSAEALGAFAKALGEHGGDPSQIEAIAMDMSPAYVKGDLAPKTRTGSCSILVTF